MAESLHEQPIEYLKLKKELAKTNQQLEVYRAENRTLKLELESQKNKTADVERALAEANKDLDELNERFRHARTNPPYLERIRGHLHPDSPVEIRAGSSAVVSDKAYIRLGRKKNVYEYNFAMKSWKEMPQHPHDAFTLVSFDQVLRTVGGESTKLYLLKDNEWKFYEVPPLPTKRCVPAVVYSENKLVVAGGLEKLEPTPKKMQIVEVLDTQAKWWSLVSSLPYGIHQTTAVRCGDTIYISPGHGSRSGVLKCLWKKLLSSKTSSSSVWSVCDSLSISNSTLDMFHGYVLAIGGVKDDHPISDIYCYREILNRWEKIGEMSVPRDECRSAVLFANTLLVVGSHTNKSNRRIVDIFRLEAPLRSQSLSVMPQKY